MTDQSYPEQNTPVQNIFNQLKAALQEGVPLGLEQVLELPGWGTVVVTFAGMRTVRGREGMLFTINLASDHSNIETSKVDLIVDIQSVGELTPFLWLYAGDGGEEVNLLALKPES